MSVLYEVYFKLKLPLFNPKPMDIHQIGMHQFDNPDTVKVAVTVPLCECTKNYLGSQIKSELQAQKV